jgi:hypothetical protein
VIIPLPALFLFRAMPDQLKSLFGLTFGWFDPTLRTIHQRLIEVVSLTFQLQ